MPVKWYGKEVSERMQDAQIAGVNATMAACVTGAKRSHDWNNVTGVLEGSIGIAEQAAKSDQGGVKGVWGSSDVVYALIHELGGIIKPIRAEYLRFRNEDGALVKVKQVTIPERPYMRPQADKEYPSLAKRIRKAFENSTAIHGGLR